MEWYGERIIQSKASDNWIPIWEDAYIDSDGDYIVIEIPLSYIKEKIIINNSNNHNVLVRNITKLVIEHNIQSSRYRGFIMHLVPSEKYYTSNESISLYNHYNKIEDNFSGKIVYSSINGEYIYQYEIENGYITKIKGNPTVLGTKSGPTLECEDILTITYTEWTYNNSTLVEISDLNYSIETVCWEVENDGLREHVSELAPKLPGGGSLAVIPEYQSLVVDNVIFRDTIGMNNIENILEQIINDTILKKLLNYLSDTQIEFIFSDSLGPGIYMSFLYDKVNQSYVIKYTRNNITIDKVFHELSHAWFRKTYPNINISRDLNAEIIAVFAEYLAQKQYTPSGGINIIGFGPGVYNSDIPRIWNNPTLEDLLRFEQFFHAQRGGIGTPYSNLTMNQNTILNQFIAFRRFFGDILF